MRKAVTIVTCLVFILPTLAQGVTDINFIGRSQASNNNSSSTASIPTPSGTTSGDIMTLVAVSWGSAPTGPSGWTPLGNCSNPGSGGGQEFIAAWWRIATGTATYSVSGNWPKAIIRDYRGPINVDNAACSGTLTIPPLAATTASHDVYIGVFINDGYSISPPADLGNGTLDSTQWWSWDGDKTIASSGTTPGAETATASGGNGLSFGITLTTNSTSPPRSNVQPYGGIIPPSGTTWQVIADDEFNVDSSINTTLWNPGPDGYPMCHTPCISSSNSTGCFWVPTSGSTCIQDCLGYGGGPSGAECQNVVSGADSATSVPFYNKIVPNVGLEIMSANDPSDPNAPNDDYFKATWNGLQSYGKITLHPGDFVEWYAKEPTNASGEGDGLHTDLWCTANNRTTILGDEIDVNERVATTSNRNLATYSIYDPGNTIAGIGTYGAPAGGNLDAGFHHYAAEWLNTGGSGSWQIYVDGQATSNVIKVNDPGWLTGVYCFAGWMQQGQTATPGGGPSVVDSRTSQNNPLIVQYFRVWQATRATPTLR